MTRRYYSSRTKPGGLTVEELYLKLQNLYLMFRDKDFFKEKARITQTNLPDAIKHEAAVDLNFRLFPIDEWPPADIKEDHVFDALEFLYDRVSKPGKFVYMQTDSGYGYHDYESYDQKAGQEEFRNKVNAFLGDYKTGFELTKDGIILAMGTRGLQYILDADIVPYNEANVDSKVRGAIAKWRNRQLSLTDKREAIRELADVFEWLKKARHLDTVLDR